MRRIVSTVCALMMGVGFIPSLAHAAVGRTAGSFSVGPDGSANYTIPLWTPPGPHGLQPSISLSYNSNGGNGTTGVGWSVSGLSSISLCNLKFNNDGTVTPADPSAANINIRYCLDGNRLQITSSGRLANSNTSGSTYQTQFANFSNVTIMGIQKNQPTYFQVQGKDGLIYEYGHSSDSRVVTNNNGYVYQWLLNKVSDRDGNSYVVTYATGITLFNTTDVSSISWSPTVAGGTNYQYNMSFIYDIKTNNKDFLEWFVGNTAFSNVNRLSSVVIGYSATGASNTYSPVRQYQLSYESSPTTSLSRLIQVLECAASTSDCMAPTKFSYQKGQLGVSTSNAGPSTGGTLLMNKYDFNGDGKSDLVFVSGSTWHVAFSTGTGFSTPVDTGIPSSITPLIDTFLPNHEDGFLYSVNGNWSYVGFNNSDPSALSFNAPVSTGIPANGTYTNDNNGDGLADLEWLSSNQIMVRMNTTTGAATYPSFATTPIVGVTINMLSPPGGQKVYSSQITLGSGVCGGVNKCDVNGDGAPDLWAVEVLTTCPISGCTSSPDVQTAFADLFSNGSGYTLSPITNSASNFIPNYIGINFNNDKCIDKITPNQTMVISGCSNGLGTTVVPLPATPVMVMDWDGDGRTDLVVANGSTLGVYLSTGNTASPFSQLITTNIPYSATSHYFAFDVDGDGLDDIAVVSSSGALNYFTHTGASGGFDTNGFDTQAPDLLNQVVDGYGNSIVPAYISTANSSSYIKGAGTQFPLMDVTDPFIAVGSVAFTNFSTSYTQSYTYKGARQDATYLNSSTSFEQVNMTDSRNGFYTSTTYAQAYPNAGQVLSVDVYQSSNLSVPVSHTSNALETLPNITLDSTQYDERYFSRIASSTVQSYEVGGGKNGQLIKTTASTYGYDGYGNATSITQKITDNDTVSPASPTAGQSWTSATTTAYSPDTGSNWCLNQPTQIVLSQSTTNPGDSNVPSQTTNVTPNYAKCRITEKVLMPGDSTYQVTTDYGYDDDAGLSQTSFGNPTSVKVTGIGMASRTTFMTWNPTGQYVQLMTDAAGETTQSGYDLSKYVQTSQTDVNGLTTTWPNPDGFGRKTSEVRPDHTSTSYTYALCSATPGVCPSGSDLEYWIKQVDNDTSGNALHESHLIYNQLGQLRFALDQTLDGSFVYKAQRRYDAYNRLDYNYVPGAGTTSAYHFYTLDLLGRVTQDNLYNADGSLFSASTTDYLGLTTVFHDAQSKKTTRVTDVNGLMRMTQDANGYAQNFSYDAAGNLLQVMDSSGNQLFKVDSYDYGIKAFQRHTTDMDLGAWSYTYDALGEITNYTDANGANFDMTYDALSRPSTRYPHATGEDTTRWTWGSVVASHEVGQLQSVCNDSTQGGINTTCSTPTYQEIYSYDSAARLSNKQIISDATYNYGYTYSPTTGLPYTLTYPTSTAGYQLTLQYGYSSTGIFNQVKDAATGTVLWQANSTNAFGEVTQEAYGNGTLTNKVFDPTTGWLKNQECGFGGGACSQNETYTYDPVGNLILRQNNNLGLNEGFFYDNVYRLDHSTLNGVINLQMGYDAMGNIMSRSDIANGATWNYNNGTQAPTHKHQVLQAGDASHTYTYDNNGNAVTRNGSAITWSSYNYPTQINAGNEAINLYYDANRQRYQQTYISNGQTETTMYVGGLTQKVTVNGVTDYRYQITAGNQLIAVMDSPSNGSNILHYVLEDHQGGISKITNSDGSSDVSESFTAFGARRNPLTWSGQPTYGDLQKINAIAREGYTGQTALGNMGLNHMNGRVEDAITGRFLSADPYITEPDNTQNYNRYSYVYNNPMSYTDPTGFDTSTVHAGNCDISMSGYIDVLTSTFIEGGQVIGSYTNEYPHIDNYNVSCLDGAPSEAPQPQPQPPPPPQPKPDVKLIPTVQPENPDCAEADRLKSQIGKDFASLKNSNEQPNTAGVAGDAAALDEKGADKLADSGKLTTDQAGQIGGMAKGLSWLSKIFTVGAIISTDKKDRGYAIADAAIGEVAGKFGGIEGVIGDAVFNSIGGTKTWGMTANLDAFNAAFIRCNGGAYSTHFTP